jgi:hypothetical protein
VRFARISNIWTVEVKKLSNSQRSIVYFERAKIVVARALSDPSERKYASRGSKFSRRYLASKIGSALSVTNQNREVKLLLQTADEFLQSLPR